MRVLLLHPILMGMLVMLLTSISGRPSTPTRNLHFRGANEGEMRTLTDSKSTDGAKSSRPVQSSQSLLANAAGISANVFILLKQVMDMPMLIRRCKTGEVNPQLSFWFFAFIGFFQMQRVVYYFLWWIFRGFHYLAAISVFSLTVCALRVGSQLRFQEGRSTWEAYIVAIVWIIQLLGFGASLIVGYRTEHELEPNSLSGIFATNGMLMSAFGSAIIVAATGDCVTMWKRKSTKVISLRYNSMTFFEKVSSLVYTLEIKDYYTFGFMIAASVSLAIQLTEYFIIWKGINKKDPGTPKFEDTEMSESGRKNPIGDMLVKISKCQSEGIQIANLAVGSPSFEPPASFLKIFSSVVESGCNRKCGSFMYTNPAGTLKLREGIASEVVGPRQGDVMVFPENIVVTAGAQSALVNVLRSILSPKDTVVLTLPFYPDFKRTVEMWGGVCYYAESDCDPRLLDINIKSLAMTMRRGGKCLKALMLCSPGNPSGKVIQKELLSNIVCLVKAHCKKYQTKVWIVLDHTYWNITWGNVEVPPLFEFYDDAIIISSFSKDLGLAGERLGFAAVNPRSDEADSLVAALTENNSLIGNLCPPSVIQHAMAEFLSVPGRFEVAVGKYKQNYRECLDELHSVLQDAGFSDISKPDGGFYLFPRLPAGVNEYVFLATLQEKNVFALPGSTFMMPGRVRFCALLLPGSEGLEITRRAIGETLDLLLPARD
mmetsp:Transcript_59704/g.69786  ORF Transcript_59704/g.69786 Transcript_59704/m.69786 type:complete len:713 (-) Transcript_59704:335-2473(-)